MIKLNWFKLTPAIHRCEVGRFTATVWEHEDWLGLATVSVDYRIVEQRRHKTFLAAKRWANQRLRSIKAAAEIGSVHGN